MRQEHTFVPAASGLQEPVLEVLASVSSKMGVDPLAERLLALQRWLGDDLIELEEAVVALSRGFVREGERGQRGRLAARHLLELSGKRLRPVCVMLAARVGGVGLTPVVRDLAVSCEIVHAATLLHDDVIDEGTDRRGAPSARVVYGNSASVLGGDHLLIEALKRVHASGLPTLMPALLEVIQEMVGGEAMQLERRGRFVPDREVYLGIIERKTASLFRFALMAGGTAAGLEQPVVDALGRAGLELGMAFQLVDDILDLEGDPRVTGKNALADLREGKLTWPFIIAAERDPGARASLKAIVEGGAPESSGVLSELVAQVRATGALEETRRFAMDRGEAATAELARLPVGAARDNLERVVEAAICRVR